MLVTTLVEAAWSGIVVAGLMVVVVVVVGLVVVVVVIGLMVVVAEADDELSPELGLLQKSRPSYTVQSSCCNAWMSKVAACWLLSSTTTRLTPASSSIRKMTVELSTAG